MACAVLPRRNCWRKALFSSKSIGFVRFGRRRKGAARGADETLLTSFQKLVTPKLAVGRNGNALMEGMLRVC